MSEASPPPPLLGAQLRRAALVSRVMAELLVTATTVRFAIASVEHAFGASQANFAQRPAAHGSATAATARGRTTVKGEPVPAPVAASGRPIRPTLSVSAAEARSDVYVNGRLVGQTPFLGDTSCKEGMPVRIEVVPLHGAALTYQRECRVGTLSISPASP
jgi:hypothetical protein